MKKHQEKYPEKYKFNTVLKSGLLTTEAKGYFEEGEKMFLKRKMIAYAILEFDAGGEFKEIENQNGSYSLIFSLAPKPRKKI